MIRPKSALEFSPNDTVEITVVPNAGACFGVVRAIKLGSRAARGALEQGESAYCFGPLIHNPRAVQKLEEQGVRTVTEPDEVKSGTVILRSHGIEREVEEEFKRRNIRIVDATCPLVKKPQQIASSVADKGCFLILVGDPKHPEVKSVLSYYGKQDFLVTYDPKDLSKIPATVKKVACLAQTTVEYAVFQSIVEKAKRRFSEVLAYNTICDATSVRQNEAFTLAKEADVVVVIGGKNSSNTCKLVKICKRLQQDTHHIEGLEEIRPQWFSGKRKIGITAGASTPHEFVHYIADHIANLIDMGSGTQRTHPPSLVR